MKKFISVLIIFSMIMFLSGCSSSKVINGKTIEPYGLLNMDDKVPGIKYELSIPDVFLGVFGFETIIFPIVCFGMHLYQPVGIKE